MSSARPQSAPGSPCTHRFRYVRKCALQFLYQLDVRQDWELSDSDGARFWSQAREHIPQAEDNDFRRRVEDLVTGIGATRDTLDERVNACAEHWETGRMSVTDRNILRLAAYEMLYLPAVPPVTSVNEAIELAKMFGDKDSPRFVNGILDCLLRQEGIPPKDRPETGDRRVSS